MAEAEPFERLGDGLRLAVRLTPRGGRAGVYGIKPDAEGRPLLHLRVAAPPVEGAANEALIAMVAKALGLRKADIVIEAGETGRVKRLHLAGDADKIAQRLMAWISP